MNSYDFYFCVLANLTHMMRISMLFFLCLCHFMASAQPEGKKPEPPPPAEFGVLGQQYTARPKKIKPNFYSPAGIALSHPLDVQEALQVLYPGNYYRMPDPNSVRDTFKLVEWACPGCPAKLLNGWIVGEKVRFPLADDNQTRWKDSVHFVDDSGRQNVFLSFSTTANQEGEDFIPSGRFTCAFMGLAWFKLIGDKWSLQAFSPGVGCYGAFQTLPDIQVIQLGKNNYGCMLVNSNGGAGGPYLGDLHVFAPVQKQFKEVLQVDNVECMNAGHSSWAFTVNANDINSRFVELQIIIEGTYRKEDFDVWATPRVVPVEIKPVLTTHDHVSFKITRVYKYGSKEKYVQASSAMEEK